MVSRWIGPIVGTLGILAYFVGTPITFAFSPTQSGSVVTVMTFNTENLFDDRHQKGKNDYTFLPLSQKRGAEHIEMCRRIQRRDWQRNCLTLDWTDRWISAKLKRVSEVILQVRSGQGADIVLLQEVENREILERLRTEYLSKADYQPSVLLEGSDDRGIDVALLSKLPILGEPKLHPIPFKNAVLVDEKRKDFRGVLQVRIRLPDGTPLEVFVLHLPAPMHGPEFRQQGLEFLNTLLSQLQPNQLAIAGGDFNITSEEDKQLKLIDIVEEKWIVSHKIGCKSCKGTVFYSPKNVWSFFDFFLLSKSFSTDPSQAGKWSVIPDSIYIANELPFQNTPQGTPCQFEVPGPRGVSDHWPMVMELKKN